MSKGKKNVKNQPAPVRTSGMKWLLLVLVFLVYGKSMRFGFVLDDDLFIRNNPVVQKGVSAIPYAFSHPTMEHFHGSNFQIYRPFTISFFALQRSLYGFDPAIKWCLQPWLS